MGIGPLPALLDSSGLGFGGQPCARRAWGPLPGGHHCRLAIRIFNSNFYASTIPIPGTTASIYFSMNPWIIVLALLKINMDFTHFMNRILI